MVFSSNPLFFLSSCLPSVSLCLGGSNSSFISAFLRLAGGGRAIRGVEEGDRLQGRLAGGTVLRRRAGDEVDEVVRRAVAGVRAGVGRQVQVLGAAVVATQLQPGP